MAVMIVAPQTLILIPSQIVDREKSSKRARRTLIETLQKTHGTPRSLPKNANDNA